MLRNRRRDRRFAHAVSFAVYRFAQHRCTTACRCCTRCTVVASRCYTTSLPCASGFALSRSSTRFSRSEIDKRSRTFFALTARMPPLRQVRYELCSDRTLLRQCSNISSSSSNIFARFIALLLAYENSVVAAQFFVFYSNLASDSSTPPSLRSISSVTKRPAKPSVLSNLGFHPSGFF